LKELIPTNTDSRRVIPLSKVLFEKLIITQLVKKFSPFMDLKVPYCVQKSLPSWRPGVTLKNKLFIYCTELLNSHTFLKLEDYP
jgi:hypothetical protein